MKICIGISNVFQVYLPYVLLSLNKTINEVMDIKQLLLRKIIFR